MLAKRASSIAPLTASAFVRRQAERTSCRLHRQRIGRTITDLRPTYDTLCGTPAQAHLSIPGLWREKTAISRVSQPSEGRFPV
jgi:hypothetical protein